jgi:hypothetical protein
VRLLDAFELRDARLLFPLAAHKSLDFARHHWHKMNIQYISFDIAFRGLGVATAPGYGKPWIAFARQKFTLDWIR